MMGINVRHACAGYELLQAHRLAGNCGSSVHLVVFNAESTLSETLAEPIINSHVPIRLEMKACSSSCMLFLQMRVAACVRRAYREVMIEKS